MELTVIITDYNTNLKWIKELDESLKQLDVEFDIVRVSEYPNKPSYKFTCTEHVTEIYCEYGNVSKSKNIGLHAATGDYVLLIDNDDKILCGKVKQYWGFDIIIPQYNDGLTKLLTNGIIFKRELIERYNLHFLDVDFWEDYYITYQLLYNKSHTRIIMKFMFYFYRPNPTSMCTKIPVQNKIKGIRNTQSLMAAYSTVDMNIVHRDTDPCIKYWESKL
jgi:glycosyltransferase involved in cell wall biosynthesis